MISFLSCGYFLTPSQQGQAGLFQPDLNPPIPQIISNSSAFILLQNLLKRVHGLEQVCLSLKYHFLWHCSSAIMSLLKLISQVLLQSRGKSLLIGFSARYIDLLVAIHVVNLSLNFETVFLDCLFLCCFPGRSQ